MVKPHVKVKSSLNRTVPQQSQLSGLPEGLTDFRDQPDSFSLPLPFSNPFSTPTKPFSFPSSTPSPSVFSFNTNVSTPILEPPPPSSLKVSASSSESVSEKGRNNKSKKEKREEKHKALLSKLSEKKIIKPITPKKKQLTKTSTAITPSTSTSTQDSERKIPQPQRSPFRGALLSPSHKKNLKRREKKKNSLSTVSSISSLSLSSLSTLLPEIAETISTSSNSFKSLIDHTKICSDKVKEDLYQKETNQMKQVMTHPVFQENPLEAIKKHLSNTMSTDQENKIKQQKREKDLEREKKKIQKKIEKQLKVEEKKSTKEESNKIDKNLSIKPRIQKGSFKKQKLKKKLNKNGK